MAAHTIPIRPIGEDGSRRLAGLLLSTDGSLLTAAILAADGRGFESQLRVEGHVVREVPSELRGFISRLLSGGGTSPQHAMLASARLAEVQAEVIAQLLETQGLEPDHLLAVAVQDPGLWHLEERVALAYQGLCDPARLAELTGLNVIDAFPARDLAQGGQGGPITPLSQWLLLRDRQQTRVLIDLGRTTRLTFLPGESASGAASRVVAMDVGPGTSLLDRLVVEMTGGSLKHDPGGRLAVQGRKLPSLFSDWLADPLFERGSVRWQPQGIRPERFLDLALRRAVDQDWSVQDILCTATHLISESVGRAIEQKLPSLPKVQELIVTGGGQHNGMLLSELRMRCGLPIARLAGLGLHNDAFPAACIATLGLLHIDRIPANQPAVTGAEVPRVLGRLTPGAPRPWTRLLQEIATAQPHKMTLRAAI